VPVAMAAVPVATSAAVERVMETGALDAESESVTADGEAGATSSPTQLVHRSLTGRSGRSAL